MRDRHPGPSPGQAAAPVVRRVVSNTDDAVLGASGLPPWVAMVLGEQGLGILITDHNVRETLSIVDRAYLICDGKVLREGTGSFLSNDPVSREMYLGPRFSM